MPYLLLGLEALAIFGVWLGTRLRGEQAQTRRLKCPLDGKPAKLLLIDVRGGRPEGINIVRCSLLGPHEAPRQCNRSCLLRDTCDGTLLAQASPRRSA
jgi:hypothetical protein